MAKVKVLIMGAAGRDFHNFNVYFRDNADYEVLAFTATQIPNIEGRKYPAALAGGLYPEGIPIYPESDLIPLIKERGIQQVIFSYSDVPYSYVMGKSAEVNAAGADFRLLGPEATMVESSKPVISICAVRTGCGKSQTTRYVSALLQDKGKRVAVIRHPMPYGDLVEQRVQRFAAMEDMDKHRCTIEEREEYEPHIKKNTVVFAGVDYEAILREAEKEADIILWDGGNNDFPFYRPDLEIVVVDPHRPNHELSYYPGEVNFRRAHVIVINKITTADPDATNIVRDNIRRVNPDAVVIDAASPIRVDDAEKIKGKHVLVIEDGPTLTHGGMKLGAGVIAALKYGAASMVDPRPYTVQSITETYQKYPDIGKLLPAMGYGREQVQDLEATINNTECELVIIATPIDLRRLVKINKPAVRVQYDLQVIGTPTMADALKQFTG
jgi:predicted GTPase